jgi:uncharacterized protein YecT (DUF1311 family)
MARCIASKRELSRLGASALACVLACAAALIVACQPRDADDIETFGAVPGASGSTATADRLESAVNSANVTDRIVTSTLQRKEAGSGNTFVVLDVSVRNVGAQPQVFSEGKLIAVQGSRERTFATPLTMLTEEFLSLQVIPPASHVRGKIAYEVPEDVAGALYWSPGNGGKPIAVHLATPKAAVATLGNADVATQVPMETSAKPDNDRPTPMPARAVLPPRPERATTTVMRPTQKDDDDERGRVVAMDTAPAMREAPRGNEPARTLACQALLTRNDPAEKASYLSFFARQCHDYEMPSSWRSEATASIPSASAPAPARRWPPRSGPAFDCSQAWTRAEHLVCEDAVLSLMDWELNRAYAKASRTVDNPAALQRDEDAWRYRVRDACDNTRCIEAAYDRRTAELEALARAQ